MDWSTYLFSALLAMTTPTHAAPPIKWTVIVGGASADTSIYANAFFPQALEIGVGDTVTWIFEGFHNVALLGGGAAPPFAVPEGDKMYWNPLIVFPAGDQSYDGTGYHNSGLPGPDGRLSYTLTFTKAGRYSYICGIHSGMLFPPGNPGKLPSSFSLTFTTPGRFEYWCLIHAEVGQRGIIVVR